MKFLYQLKLLFLAYEVESSIKKHYILEGY